MKNLYDLGAIHLLGVAAPGSDPNVLADTIDQTFNRKATGAASRQAYPAI